MAVLSDLPFELVLQIFSKLKYEDRFETCKVSNEWFFLTLKTYQDKMTPENDLLVSMADFFNQATGTKKYSYWLKLYRKMKPTNARIYSTDSSGYFNAVDKCKASLELVEMDMGQFVTEFWKSYPKLKFIHVRSGFVPEGKVNVLKEVFGSLYIQQLVCEEASGHYLDFRLERIGSNFAMSTVVLKFGELPRRIFAAALKAIKESKTVHTFLIINPVITAQWNKVFPSSVRKLMLFDPVIRDSVKSVVSEAKDLLFYVCHDWTSVKDFQIRLRKFKTYGSVPCRKLEAFYVSTPKTPAKFTPGFECVDLTIGRLRSAEYLKGTLPTSILNLRLQFDEMPRDFSPKQLFTGSTDLQRLSIEMPLVKNLSFGDFTGLASLRTLLLDCIGPKALATILLSLTSLRSLAAKKVEENTFTRLPDDVVCTSLNSLGITGSSINNSFILRHAPNLKQLIIHEYDPKKHQVGFLCSSEFDLDLVMITGKYDLILCRAIGSDLANYPYKCIIADWRFPSIHYTYVLSRNVDSLRETVTETQSNCIQKMSIYAHGFSMAFIDKKSNLEVYFEVERFLNVVDWRTCQETQYVSQLFKNITISF